MTILAPFGRPWTILASFWWSSGARMHAEEPWKVPVWILNDFMDFGPPIRTPFCITVWYFLSFGVSKSSHDFCWLLNCKSADFWCPNLSIYMVHTNVLLRFHFVDFFMDLMLSGPCLDLILDTLPGLGSRIWWFLGYWRLLEISMIFGFPPEISRAERRRQVEGKVIFQGVQ